MIKHSLLKFSFIWNLTSFSALKYDCVIKAKEVFNFLVLINNSVTILLRFLLLSISAIISSKTIKIFRFLNFLMCITYSVLSCKLATSFSTF